MLTQRLQWRAAAVEALAILTGILLAFGIQAAWETRNERVETEAYLASLALELEANRARVEEHVGELERSITLTETYLVAVVASPTGPVSQDSLRGMTAQMGPIPSDFPQRAAFEDLISGGLRLIDDPPTRRLILAYGQALDRDAQVQATARVWFETRGQPYDEQEADLVGMGSRHFGGWAGRTDVSFDVDLAAFVGNRRYGNLLAHRAFALQDVVEVRKQLLAAIVDLQERLGGR